MTTRLSPYGQASVEPSPVNRMMAQFASGFRDGIDINLGVGYVNEQTIPVELFVEAMQVVAEHPVRYRQAFNYGGAAGSANLVSSLHRATGDAPAGTRTIIGPCGATSILDGLASVLEPGVVVTSDPMYYIYCDALERRGFEVLAVPEDDEGIAEEALARKLHGVAERISFFYVVTVNNPSCTILSNRRRRALLGVAARLSREQGRLIPIVYDLAYELLVHDPAVEPLVSVLAEDHLGIAYETGTLSKVLAPALRLGYLRGPDGPLMNAMVQRTSDLGFSAPLFVQEMASYLLDEHFGAQLERVNAGYRDKAVAVRAALEHTLGSELEACRGGSAGFYFYLTFRRVETHPASPFFRYLTRAAGEPGPRVIYIPGEYCVHPRGDLVEAGRRQLRLSYGFEEVPAIERALLLMREAAEYAGAC